METVAILTRELQVDFLLLGLAGQTLAAAF